MTLDSAAGSHPRGFALTPLGAHLAKLPVEPRWGRCSCTASRRWGRSGLFVAAAMTCKPAFVARGPDASDKHAATAAKRLASDEAGGASDHLAIARAFARWRESPAEATRTYSLARGTMRDVARARDQLARTLRESGFDPDGPACAANANNDDLARCALVAGLFPNVARVAPGEKSGGKGGGGRGGGHGAGRASAASSPRASPEVAVHPSA